MHTGYVSVREALLALLVDGPKHGYQLKTEFDEATGATWALNVGQVYTTLQRLERDKLVGAAGPPDSDGRITYLLTEEGRAEMEHWLHTPSSTPIASRDETSMRVLLSLATGAAPVLGVLSSQRDAAMETLQALTAMKAEPQRTKSETAATELAWRLQLDRMIFLAEAEIRWLELTESRLMAMDELPAGSTTTAGSATTAGSTVPTFDEEPSSRRSR